MSFIFNDFDFDTLIVIKSFDCRVLAVAAAFVIVSCSKLR
jgi:hypothetical protein